MEYESLAPIEQFRHQVEELVRNSSTLRGDHIVAYTNWRDMTARQRRDCLKYQVEHLNDVDLPHAEREAITAEALGYGAILGAPPPPETAIRPLRRVRPDSPELNAQKPLTM